MKNGILFYLIIAGVFLEGILATMLGKEDFPITLFQISFLTSFAVFLGYKLSKDDFELYQNNYTLALLLFTALIFLSLIYSTDRMNGLLNAIRFLLLVLFVGLVTNLIYDRSQLVKGLIVSSIVCLILAGISIGESLFNPEIVIQNFVSQGAKLTRSAAAGLFSDPNRFAASLFIPLAFSFSIMNSELDTKYRITGGLVFLMILGGVITSYSRSGFLAVAIICILNVYFFRRFKPFLILGAVGIITVLAIPSLRLTMFSYSERILDLLTGVGDTSSGIRVLLGFASIKMFLTSYGLGVGFDAFNNYVPAFVSIQKTVGVVEPHNITYTVLSELGIQGFFVFAMICYFLFRDAYGNIRMAVSTIDRVIAIGLFSSFCGYVLFYQFYGGGLLDNILMFNIALMLVHKRFLSNNDNATAQENATPTTI